MTDAEMILGATLVTTVLLRTRGLGQIAETIDPLDYYEETQDFVCLVQQMIAEATGLVGNGDI